MDRLPSSILPTARSGESPFLAASFIQFAWDSTSLGWFKRCPRLYELKMIWGWRPLDENVHLRFGQLYTEALEAYHILRAQELSHYDALEQVVLETLEDTWIIATEDCPAHPWQHGAWDEGIGNKNRYTLLRTIIWYLDEFENDPAETVIAEDGTPLVERSFRMELNWGPHAATLIEYEDHIPIGFGRPTQPYIICGHIDRVVNFLGQTFVTDHKTTKTTIGDYYFDQYEPNNQMSTYAIAGNIVFETEVKGVIIDAAQVAVGFSRFARGITYRTKAQSEEWINDLRHWLELAESYAKAQYWPMNDTACFNCEFNKHDGKICAKDPSVRETFLNAKFEKGDPWNPLAIRN